MSWLTDIAGKAEDLLNRVDQTAATALQNKAKISPFKPGDQYLKAGRNDESYGATYSSNSAFSSPQRKASKLTRSPESKNFYNPSIISGSRKKPESDDEKLLQFLNSNETVKPEQYKHEIEQKTVKKPKELVSAMNEIDSTSVKENDQMKITPEENFTVSEDSKEPSTANDVVQNELSTVSVSTSSCDTFENISENENTTMQPELIAVEKRALHAEAEMKRMMKKLDHWNSQISSNDMLVRELQEREKDMVAAMDAKDSQLAILKVRLQEADQELSTKQNKIDELSAENERIVKEHAEGATFQNKTVEVLRDQLQQAEAELNRVKESLHQSQIDHMNQRSKIEEEHRLLVESYTSLQKKWNDIGEMLSEAVKLLKGDYVVTAINEHKMDKGIIFCRTKVDCDNMENHLNALGGGPRNRNNPYSCVCLHGDRKPHERKENLEKFKRGDVKFLICTDVAARGIDVSGVPYVINVTLPDEKNNYVHRIGRVGRAERMGLAISLASAVPEKVWYHSNCANRGRNCWNTRLTDQGGCCIWYNEPQFLADIEEHLNCTIQQVDPDIKVPCDDFDGKVVYGQKRAQTGSNFQTHTSEIAPSLQLLQELEMVAQKYFIKRYCVKDKSFLK